VPGHQPGEGGQEHPVDTAQLRVSGLPLQHRQLLAKYQDLGLTLANISFRC
jgi:hypothetical protein